jgi:hypothetical protein
VGVRIGTWNMDGRRWTPEHAKFMVAAACDVWLLTEVNEQVELEGYVRHLSVGLVNTKRRWAGILSRRPIDPLPDPHFATAAAVIGETTYFSTVLPWKDADSSWPGQRHAGKTEHAVNELLRRLRNHRLVWGGDWNHSLSGVEGAGTMGGRAHVLAAVEQLGLKVPTAELPHRLAGLLSIDHIAVAVNWAVTDRRHLDAVGLSDHDCYVIDVAPL